MAVGIQRQEALRACEALSGRRPDDVSAVHGAPGMAADCMRVRWGAETAVLSRCLLGDRARREARVLAALRAHGAPVPEILAFDGLWTLQEDIGDDRLPDRLDKAPAGREDALGRAIASLADCHEAARAAEPVRFAFLIGFRRDWLERLVDGPRQIGARLGVDAPALDVDALVPFLRARSASVLKWEARPGDAVFRADGACVWSDWRHCGRRNPLDDLAWLLSDEAVPEDPALEARLLKTHIARFSHGFRSAEEALLYLLTYGTLHMARRLDALLPPRLDGQVTPVGGDAAGGDVAHSDVVSARRLCHRAARWALANPATRPLSGWFQQAGEALRRLERMTEAA